ncbi:MAG: hypothetical protein RJB38_1531 [Pseudomonadota bacterium]|jgi:hypothetical protein
MKRFPPFIEFFWNDKDITPQCRLQNFEVGMKAQTVVIVGDGWAALSAVAEALGLGKETHTSQLPQARVVWVSGTGGRVLAAVPSVEGEAVAAHIEALASALGVETGERISGGSFLREFRNRSFREPVWNKAHSLEEKRERRSVELWKAEVALAPLEEVRWTRSLVEIEEDLRERLIAHPGVTRREGLPLEAIEFAEELSVNEVESGAQDHANASVLVFASGERLTADRIIYADRWSKLSAINGIPKVLAWNRGREPMGVLQVLFSHAQPMRPEVTEAFFTTLNRDAGETEDRHVFGHFFREGRESIWSTVISQEEGEDNHLITKKLRRMKQALDKMFSQSEWTSGAFEATIQNEQVRFEEQLVFAHGTAPLKPQKLKKGRHADFAFEAITDGYGVSAVLELFAPSRESAIGETLNEAPSDGMTSSEVSAAVEASVGARENEGRIPSAQAEISV